MTFCFSPPKLPILSKLSNFEQFELFIANWAILSKTTQTIISKFWANWAISEILAIFYPWFYLVPFYLAASLCYCEVLLVMLKIVIQCSLDIATGLRHEGWGRHSQRSRYFWRKFGWKKLHLVCTSNHKPLDIATSKRVDGRYFTT